MFQDVNFFSSICFYLLVLYLDWKVTALIGSLRILNKFAKKVIANTGAILKVSTYSDHSSDGFGCSMSMISVCKKNSIKS